MLNEGLMNFIIPMNTFLYKNVYTVHVFIFKCGHRCMNRSLFKHSTVDRYLSGFYFGAII